LNGVKYLMSHAQVLLDRTGAPDNLWFVTQDYLAHVQYQGAHRQLNWKIPEQVSSGGSLDISHILMFYWFEPVMYLDPGSKFQLPETTESPEYFVGIVDYVGDGLILHRSLGRSAADASHRNRRESFKSEVQESVKLLDTKPRLTFVWKDSHHKHNSIKTNNDSSNRTRSKADYTDQHVGNRTRSKMHNINVNKLHP
jgi:hypothetical protein